VFFREAPRCSRKAFHSTADIGNELLLLLGMRRSARPAESTPSLRTRPKLTSTFIIRCWWRLHFFAFGGALGFFIITAGYHNCANPRACLVMQVGTTQSLLCGRRPWMPTLVAGFPTVLLLAQKRPQGRAIWDEIIGSKDPTIFFTGVFWRIQRRLWVRFLAFLGIFPGDVVF